MDSYWTLRFFVALAGATTSVTSLTSGLGSGIPQVKHGQSDDRENRARKTTAVSVDFIDDGCIRVAEFVASRFFGRIGCFQEAFLDPTLAQQRRGARLMAE